MDITVKRTKIKNKLTPKQFIAFKKQLKLSKNASTTAIEYGLKPMTVVHFCRRENIPIQSPGKPYTHEFDGKKLLLQLRKAVKYRGGIAALVKVTGLPYNCIYRFAIKNDLIKRKLCSL